MPTYEYSREDGTVFDHFQGINDAALEVCPTTGQKVKRIISGGTGVIYKGEGWYVTDYKNKGGGSNGKSNGSGATDSSTSAEPAASATPEKPSGSPASSDT